MPDLKVIKGGSKTLLIGIPCQDMVHTEFMQSMINMDKPEGACYTVVKNTLIHDARNIIASNAAKEGFKRLAFFDSDMIIPKNALTKMMAHMDAGCEFVTGLYVTRRPPKIKPVIYKELWYDFDGEKIDQGATNYYDYPNGLFQIEAAGFGCCLVSMDLINDVGSRYGLPFEHITGMGEDMSFCYKAITLGHKLYCDSTIKCGHVGTKVYTESDLHPIAP